MAQDVQKALEDIGYDDINCIHENEGQLGLDITTFIPVLINSIQEQQKQIEKLQAQIEIILKIKNV